jgi:hypothetical protein
LRFGRDIRAGQWQGRIVDGLLVNVDLACTNAHLRDSHVLDLWAYVRVRDEPVVVLLHVRHGRATISERVDGALGRALGRFLVQVAHKVSTCATLAS